MSPAPQPAKGGEYRNTGNGVKERAEYNWADATRDLALTTSFTLQEIDQIVRPLAVERNLHPFDAVPYLIEMLKYVKTGMNQEDYRRFGNELQRLMQMDRLGPRT